MSYRLKKKRKSTFIAQTLVLAACLIIATSAVQLVHSSSEDFWPWQGNISNGGNNLGNPGQLNTSSPCTINTYGQAWNGYLAYGVFQFNSSDIWQVLRSYLVIMSTNNYPVLFRETHDQSYFAVKYIAQDTILFQGEPGFYTHFWNLRTNQTTDLLKVWSHHDIVYNPVNNTFLTLQEYVRRINGTDVLVDKVEVVNAKGDVLWSWDTSDHIFLNEACPLNDTFPVNGENVMDLTHSNTLQWDYKENIFYLNVRNTNTFYKVNMTTGKIIWACGAHGNFTLLDANGKSVNSLWYHSHSVKEVEPDVFIMFDNDYHNATNPNNRHSRIIEVTLNEKNMTAWVSWSWAAPEQYWATWGGDADRLPNGDRIGTFGTQTHFVENSTGAILAEVNPKGQLVRTFTFPYGIGIYRIEEIPLETFSDYDGAWRTTDFQTKLAAGNDLGGLYDIYYKINSGPTMAVSIDGQPHITKESANNTLEYWSVDSGGLEEVPHKTLTGIKLDETPPNVSITSPLNGSQIKTSTVTVTWAGSDDTSGISQYEIELDTGLWTSTGTNTTYTFTGLSDGNHTIDIRALDVAGNNKTLSANFAINTSSTAQPTPSPTPSPTLQPTPSPTPAGSTVQPDWIYVVIAGTLVAAAVAVALITYALRAKKHTKT